MTRGRRFVMALLLISSLPLLLGIFNAIKASSDLSQRLIEERMAVLRGDAARFENGFMRAKEAIAARISESDPSSTDLTDLLSGIPHITRAWLLDERGSVLGTHPADTPLAAPGHGALRLSIPASAGTSVLVDFATRDGLAIVSDSGAAVFDPRRLLSTIDSKDLLQALSRSDGTFHVDGRVVFTTSSGGNRNFVTVHAREDLLRPGHEFVRANMLVLGLLIAATILFGLTATRSARRDAERVAVLSGELRELKSEFLETMAHELDDPLTNILGLSGTLQDHWSEMDEALKQDFAGRIRLNSLRLEDIVTEMIDFSRIESGRLSLTIRPTLLVEEARRSVVRLNEMVKHHRVTLMIPEDLGVSADPRAVRHILDNLISNAAKYSEPGSLVVVRGAASGDHAVICVDDEGVGVPSEDVDRIFDPFYRGIRDHSATGTGIGLSIVKRLLGAMGGSISVEPGPVRGSTFRVTLTLATRQAIADASLVGAQSGS